MYNKRQLHDWRIEGEGKLEATLAFIGFVGLVVCVLALIQLI